MEITAALVKELRERTGAGMMECKKSLVEAQGDIELAIENMRKSGLAKAAKKAGRIAAEGVILVKTTADGAKAIAVEVNCETDFVAKDASFLAFANKVADLALAGSVDNLDVLAATIYDGADTVEIARAALVAKIGENINVRRISLVAGSLIGAYSHGSRIGVLVSLEGGDLDLARDLAMHVAASNPLVVSAEQVPAETLAKEKEIAEAKAAESGKPANIIEKMVEGALRKFVEEVSLNGQAFVKDPSVQVGKLVASKGAKVVSFIRLEVGEGIEKKEENFAAEVAAAAAAAGGGR
jgi:elongation factor Ts